MIENPLAIVLTPWQANKIKERQLLLNQAQELYKDTLALIIAGVIDPTTISGCGVNVELENERIVIIPPTKPSIVKENANESDTE